MKPLPPCKACRDRRVGCHDPAVCEKWADFEKASEDFRRSVQPAQDEARIVAEYVRGKHAMLERHLKEINKKPR